MKQFFFGAFFILLLGLVGVLSPYQTVTAPGIRIKDKKAQESKIWETKPMQMVERPIHKRREFEENSNEPMQNAQKYLRRRSQELGLDYPLLFSIIQCESGWRMVKNKNSSAFGYFQIIDSTEKITPQYQKGQRKFDPFVNLEMGLWLFEKQGTRPWNASKHCWLYQ